MNRIIFITYIIFCSCNLPHSVNNIALSDFEGCWKDINQKEDQVEKMSLRIYYFNDDSNLAMIQYEPGPRSRIWMNVEEIRCENNVLYYDEFTAKLNSTKDTLTVEYHDPSGNMYPFVLVRVQDTRIKNFMKGFVRSLNNRYTYKKPDKLQDGWTVEEIDKLKIDRKKLYEMISKIIKGKYYDIHSLLIIKNSRIILEEYFGGRGRLYGDFIKQLYQNKLHNLASVTKPVTSLLAGCALNNGFITSVNDPVYLYLPKYTQLQTKEKKSILLKHLLTMSSGLDWHQFGFSFQDSRNDAGNMYKAKDVLAYYFSKPMTSKPGISFNYSNASATAVGALIQNASKMNIDLFSNKYLFQPLGITNYEWEKYPDNTYDTDGGLDLTSRDIAKIGQLVLNNGSWNNKQIVSAEWISESTSKKLQRANSIGYGYYWQQTDFTVNNKTYYSIMAWGDGGQFLFIFPELKMIVVSTAGNYGKGQDRVIFDMLDDFILPAMQMN